MEQAKSVISSIIGRSGKHDTSVDETVNPAVVQEEVVPTRVEEQTTAVDREVHQDHHHTTVQPLEAKEVLPEQHTSQVADVEERQFRHDDEDETQRRLAEERARFQESSTTLPTTETTSQAPTVEGEHVHHHVHETVQPVIQKETVQPEVIHTTIPIHEKHLAPTEHHGQSVLPTKNLSEFESSGGSLAGGQQVSRDTYEGDPRPYNPELQREQYDVDKNPRAHDGLHDESSTGHQGGTTDTSDTGHSGAGLGTAAGVGAVGGAGIGMAERKSAMDNNDTIGTGSAGTAGAHTAGLDNSTGAPGGTLSQDMPSTTGNTGAVAGPGGISTGQHISEGENRAEPNVDSRTGGSGLGEGVVGAGAGAGAGLAAEEGVHDRDTNTNLSGGLTTGQQDTSTGSGLQAADDVSRRTGEPSTNVNEGTTDAVGPTSGGLSGSNTATETGPRDTAVADTTTTGTTGAEDTARDTTHKEKKDPAVDGPVGDDHPKLTGTGAPGSHSAYFGLTPDGHRDTNTSSTTTAPVAVSSSKKKTGDPDDATDSGSRAPTGAGVSKQLNDPKVAEKGHDGSAVESTGSPADQAGAGTSLTTPSQGTGTVKPGEHGTGAETATET